MYYEVKGEGEPLVMIMGLSANVDWWDPPVVEELAKEFRLLMFDNRDAGRTTGPATPYTLRDMADDTARLMDHVSIESANIMGLSMGGMIAQEFVLAYPHRVKRLILGCTTPGSGKGIQAAPEVLQGLAAPSVELLVAGLPIVLFTPEWCEANPAWLKEAIARLGAHPPKLDGYQRQIMAIMGFDASSRLGDIKAPTLVLHGDRDILVPPANGHILAEDIPGAKLVVFPGCGHGFSAMMPDLFLDSVRSFLRGKEQGAVA